jgi:hypothetical protein
LRSNNPDVIARCEEYVEIAGIPITFKDLFIQYRGPIIFIIDGKKNSINFECKTNTLRLEVVWENIQNQSSTLKNIIGQMISYVCWINDVYPIHSASVSKKGHSILFLGASASGKTNLSYVLAKYKGYEWLGNDWIGLSYFNNNISVEKGHDLINFSALGCEQLQAAGFNLEIADRLFQKDSSSAWTKTRYYSYTELGVTAGNLPSKVESVIFLNIQQGGKCSLEKIPQNIIINYISKELFWPLRGCGSFVIDNHGHVILPSVSIQPENGCERACYLANKIIDGCKIFQLSGSLESLFNDFGSIEAKYIRIN